MNNIDMVYLFLYLLGRRSSMILAVIPLFTVISCRHNFRSHPPYLYKMETALVAVSETSQRYGVGYYAGHTFMIRISNQNRLSEMFIMNGSEFAYDYFSHSAYSRDNEV